MRRLRILPVHVQLHFYLPDHLMSVQRSGKAICSVVKDHVATLHAPHV